MDFPAHIEEQFQWLLTMARSPGWKAQAWRRAQELEASSPMYAGFAQRLKEAMQPASQERSDG